jgi:hypothetical protein
MSRRRAATSLALEGEVFNAGIRSKLEEYQNAHRARFESHRLPRPTAELYLKYLNYPDSEAHNENEQHIKQTAAKLFTVINGQLH